MGGEAKVTGAKKEPRERNANEGAFKEMRHGQATGSEGKCQETVGHAGKTCEGSEVQIPKINGH